MSNGARWSVKISSWILFAVVALAPLPFGSTDGTAIAMWCVVLGIGSVLAPMRGLSAGQAALIGLAFIVIAAYAVVLHEQLAEHPWFAASHPLWREAGEILGQRLEPAVSIARNAPLFAVGAPLACMLSLICSFLVCVDRNRARRLLWVIAWSGAAYAAYGILSHLIDPTQILWRDKQAYLSFVTGTFINHNTAATYFGSCSIVWLVLLSERIREILPRGRIVWHKAPNRLLNSTPRDIVMSFSMLFLCLAAMFMTGSRAGVVLSLLALVVAFAAYFHRDLPRRGGLIAAALGGGALALVLLQIMGAGVSGRFDTEGLAIGGRLNTYRATLRMIADHPWFGTGQGTFAWAYPPYRSDAVSLWGVWDRAHNAPLEIASDMGLPLTALIFVAWIVVAVVLINGVKTRRRDLAMPVGALAVAILAILHSVVDFSLQIPGYAIVAFALIGAGLAQSFGRPTPATETKVPKSGLKEVREKAEMSVAPSV